MSGVLEIHMRNKIIAIPVLEGQVDEKEEIKYVVRHTFIGYCPACGKNIYHKERMPKP